MFKLEYQPELDGLRGVAVAAVVIFHAGVNLIPGGYVGVDMFFVLSGFLICSVILRDMALEQFSLIGFWERRARRILPALFVMLIGVTILSLYFLRYPPDFRSFGRSLQMQSVFLSNMYFMYKTNNYFDPSTDFFPLLHTWTLAVEEQFYLVFPIFVLVSLSTALFFLRQHKATSLNRSKTQFNTLLHRAAQKFFKTSVMKDAADDSTSGQDEKMSTFARTLFIFLITIFISSLAYSILLVNVMPHSSFSLPIIKQLLENTLNATAGFYLLFSRAWEPALGALLALYISFGGPIKHRKASGVVGIILILCSLFLFSNQTQFPGFAALVPTIGTALVILSVSGGGNFIRTLLTFRFLVWLGVISYSLYLWHWPLLVFTHTFPQSNSFWLTLATVGVAIFIAWMSYRFVETPIRKKIYLSSRRSIFTVSFVSLVVIFVVGNILTDSQMQSRRVPEVAARTVLASEDINPRRTDCLSRSITRLMQNGPCVVGDTDDSKPITFLLWGDSHSDAIMKMVDTLAEQRGFRGAYIGQTGCIPILGVKMLKAEQGDTTCNQVKEYAMDYIQKNHIMNVFLVARWNLFIDSSIARISDDIMVASTADEAAQVFERTLSSTISRLKEAHVHVFVMRQVPEQSGFNVRKTFYSALHDPTFHESPTIDVHTYEQQHMLINNILTNLARDPSTEIIDPASTLCDSTNCYLANSTC